MRKAFLFKAAVVAMGVVFLATSMADAQRRKKSNQRGQRGNRGFGGFNPVSILSNEYLQKELNFTSAQKQRVKEITLQMDGTSALLKDAVVAELGISETQKESIKKAQEEANTKRREAFRSLFQGGQRPSREEMTKKFQELREQSDKSVLAVLTKSQQAKWEKMQGKKIDRTKLITPRGGNRPKTKRPNV